MVKRTRSRRVRVVLLEHWNHLPPPLFILGPPRSFTSLACAMLGQHPQLYGLPETHLFPFETLGARAQVAEAAAFPMAHGLLRAVAQLYFGGQTRRTVRAAQRWLTARSSLTPDFLFKLLADKVFPRVLVDKSPSSVDRREILDRIRGWFPTARFIHLVRHPRGHGKSVIKYLHERAKYGSIPPSHWLLRISSYPPPGGGEDIPEAPRLDPQYGWYTLHRNIAGFLDSIPADRWKRVRGEDLLTCPDRGLGEIAAWMGIRSDVDAIERMKHPEHSPYAFLGPRGARYGNDAFFLKDPVLRPIQGVDSLCLNRPLEWRNDGVGFCAEVQSLAREFGYE
jgi:hypothetical protein